MSEENLYTFENPEYRKTFWHTSSHVMAQAVKRLWPEVQLAIGPAIDEGWYYDFDAPFSFTPDHLSQIEAEMKKIVKENLKIERFELPRAEAIAFMQEKNEPYKVQLIEELPEDAVISFYRQGEFTDLCAGAHLLSTGMVKAFFDMSTAGNNIDIQLLSGGIYEAMVTTVGGLIVGIIANFLYSILVGQINKVIFMLEARTMEFMDLLHEPAK